MRAAVGFILVTITLDILSMSLVIPVLPRLIQHMEGSAAAAAHAVGIFATAWALMQFLFSPVLGALSDRFGRRPVILLSNLGLGLNGLLMAVAPDVRWLFGRVISGITAASFSCATAYIADMTPAEKRAARFGLVSIALALALSPARWPAACSRTSVHACRSGWPLGSACRISCSACSCCRSCRNGAPCTIPWRRANPVGALRLLRSRPGPRRPRFRAVAGPTAQNALPTITVLYAINRYGFTIRDLSVLLGAMGISSALVGGVLTGPVVRRLGERRALLAGLVCGVAGFAAMGLATTPTMFLLAIPLLSLRGFADPALTALMTRRCGRRNRARCKGRVAACWVSRA